MDRLEELLIDLACNKDMDFIRPIMTPTPHGVAEQLTIEVAWKDGTTCRYTQLDRHPFYWEMRVPHQPCLTE